MELVSCPILWGKWEPWVPVEPSTHSKDEVLKVFRTTEIIEAARRVIMDVGYPDASMDRIAQAAGVAKGTLYLYFKNKDELLARTFAEEHDHMMDNLRKSAQSVTGYTKQLRSLVHATMKHAIDHQAFRQALVGAPDISPFGTSVASIEIRREIEDYGGFVAEIIEQGMRAGEFREGNAAKFAMYLTQLVAGAVTTLLRKPDDNAWQESVDEITDFFLQGAQSK
jgi:TetR/AcrR family fatty acid metabolism transcriptional regulator